MPGLKHLEDFGATRPQYRIDAITARAKLLASNGDVSGALALLDAALKEYPDASELRFARVFQLEAADEVDDAIAELRKLVSDRPGDPAATNALGYTLVDRTRHHREGLKLIEEALAQTPDSGAVLDSMGWALHRSAATRRRSSISSTPSAASTIRKSTCISAKCCWRWIARTRRATCGSKASERYPDNDELKQRLQKLELTGHCHAAAIPVSVAAR